MTLTDARQFRDYIHSKNSINCTVPLGFGPDGYFPCSIMKTGQRFWKSRAEFRKWAADDLRNSRRIMRDDNDMMWRRNKPKARSPIEIMVDRACGLC